MRGLVEVCFSPGQFDAVHGTYGQEFVEKNVLCVAFSTEKSLVGIDLMAVMAVVEASHAALRTTVRDGATFLRTHHERGISPTGPEHGIFLDRSIDGGIEVDQMNTVVSEVGDLIDLSAGITWGVVSLTSPEGRWLLLVVNHMVCDLVSLRRYARTFADACSGSISRTQAPDRYFDYLAGVSRLWSSRAAGDASRWIDQPWENLPSLHQVGSVGSERRGQCVTRTDDVVISAAMVSRDAPSHLARTLARSLNDIVGLSVTRVDRAIHGRSSSEARASAGWISHAVPDFTTWSGGKATMPILDPAGWIRAFPHVRARIDLTRDHHLRAHAFVNDIGRLTWRAPQQAGVSLVPVQPNYSAIKPESLTPIHVRNRRIGSVWHLSWSFRTELWITGVADEIADRVVSTLSTSSA
jgi:hypothetical protein